VSWLLAGSLAMDHAQGRPRWPALVVAASVAALYLRDLTWAQQAASDAVANVPVALANTVAAAPASLHAFEASVDGEQEDDAPVFDAGVHLPHLDVRGSLAGLAAGPVAGHRLSVQFCAQ
jgi:hypothetical protein